MLSTTEELDRLKYGQCLSAAVKLALPMRFRWDTMRIAALISLIAVLLTIAGGLASAVLAAERSTGEGAESIRSLQTQLHNRQPAQRVEAIRRLRSFPAMDAAKAIVPWALSDRVEDVRRAAYDALLSWKDDREVCDLLLKTLDKEAGDRKSGGAIIPALVAVLLASNLPGTEAELDRFLERYLVKSKDAAAAVTAVADEFGKQEDEQALRSLQKLSKLKCFSESFACRRATVQAMIQIRRPEAIDALMALLPQVSSEVAADIVRHLTQVSGEHLGGNLAAWRGWWKEHRKGFEFPPKAAQSPLIEVVSPGTPSYYGLSLNARRIVFVLDTSGSMNGPRLQAAKYELVKAIEGLGSDVHFGIVVFNNVVAVWQRNLVVASPSTRRAAAQFVYTRHASGRTAAYDALEATFHFDAEAIYFLSDGAPNVGKITAPADIVAAVSRANRSRRISVYTLGIAPGPPDGAFDLFLRTLAEDNYGIYRRIDQ